MSVNHYFSTGLPEHSWWSRGMESPTASNRGLPPGSTSAAGTMGANEEDAEFADDLAAGDAPERDREPLFEKPLTPSDVGKLNRLVIPKQHAEKYLPMNGCGGTESGAENGVLLDFEDEVGKKWRFRYSYWNSSQSYVLTKGWSRFVKEKHLDAGDVVTFSRRRSRLFIGWRRRKPRNTITSPSPPPQTAIHSGGQNNTPKTTGSPVFKNQTATGNSKRLRLFGVNLEFQSDEPEPSMPIDSPITVQFYPHHQYYPDQTDNSGDVYRQR